MKSITERTSQTVGNILQVTKNTIQLNENYHDYYINKDNALYRKQLPLLIQKSNMQAIAIRKRENEKNVSQTEENKDKSNSLDKISFPLSGIRNAQIRSKKLPPLCPFYSNKGELLRSVVTTSKVFNKLYLNDNVRTPTLKSIKLINLNNKQREENSPRAHLNFINFDNFQNDFFYEPEHESLTFKDYEIFGKKEYYFQMIKNKINDFKVNDISDTEFKKEKIFEKNKQRKIISLTFNSISVKIYELKKEEKDKETNEDEYRRKKKDPPVFEYNLPFIFLPLFYLQGEEKFKIFLSKIIKWDNNNNKFILNENPEKIFQDILKSCSDFNKVEKKEEKKKEVQPIEEVQKPSRSKFNATMGGKKTLKSDLQRFRLNTGRLDEKSFAQTMLSPNPTYITNLDDNRKKYDVVSESSIYPTKKENNYINFNVFEFLWITPEKNFKVIISSPLISVNIPKNRIKVRKYIDFELLFYLYEKNFENWDFYVVRYLSSFKSFRTLLEEINSINETSNKDFYLTQPRIKNYSFGNIKMINIVTIKQKDILENLIEGLMGIPEDKNEENKNKVKENNKKGNEKEEKKKEEKENNKENETKKEEKENNEENKKENKEEIKKEEDTKNTEKEKGNNTEEKNEEKQNEELMNSTFVQKSFIAIIRFVDIKTFKANEFKIYFNFSQFAKFQKMEPFIDKISFLIKFIDINYIKKSVYIDYKSLDCFDVNEWIKDYNKYNHLYLKTMDNKANTMADFHRTSAEYLGMVKNSLIQIEIYTPISLARTINDVGAIKTDKIFMNNNFQDKVVSVEKDDILGLSKIFYDSYEEGQNKKA